MLGTENENGLAIEVRGLSKALGRAPVLRGLDLEVPWGEVLTVLGPNGSGKTTLIRTLASLMKPDRGVVRVGGIDPARAAQALRQTLGVVTHEPMLYDQLTGRENLTFVARMFGLDNIEERVQHCAARMGVKARLDQRVAAMSHGLRKRFSIARALLHDPAVLLLDEPESGLDQEALGLLEDIVAGHAGPSRAVLMTTHNLERGLGLGNRMAILSRGRIAYEESLDAVGTAAARNAYARYTGVSA